MKLNLEVVANDGKVKVNLPGDRTSGITPTPSGAAFIPDWNNRHSTWTANKNTSAPFHRITDETRDEQIVKVKHGSEDKYPFEIYSAYGAFGQLKPANWVNTNYLQELNTDAYADVLEGAGIMERSENQLWFSLTRLITYIGQLVQDKGKLVEFPNRVYNGIGRRKVWESGSRFFFTPGFKSFILQRPDGYVMELSMTGPVNVFDRVWDAQSVNVMCRLFDGPVFSTQLVYFSIIVQVEAAFVLVVSIFS